MNPRHSGAGLLLVALELAALAPAGVASAEPVKLLKPEQYAARIVAPRRGRALVVNFWATWCQPCREEMPELMAATKGFRASELAVVLVSVDDQKKGPASVPRFLAQNKVPFVCWLVKSRDPQNFIDAVDKSWDGSLPFTLVYDRKGKVFVRLVGKQTESSFAEAIRKVLGS